MRHLFSGVLALALAACGLCAQPLAAGEADEVFNSLYSGDLKRVQATAGTDDDLALARQFLDAAKTTAKQPALIALLCEKTYDLAARDPGGFSTAAEAMKLLTATSPAKRVACADKTISLYQGRFNSSRGDEREQAGNALIGCLLALADQAADADDAETAVRYAQRATYVAAAIRSAPAQAVREKVKEFRAQEGLGREMADLRRRLLTEPKDLAARSRLVWLLMVERDKPAEAAKLAGDCGEPLRTYVPMAAQDAAALADTACLELADWYRAQVAKASPGGKPAMLRRAKAFYEAFLAKHPAADLNRTKATLALKKVDESLEAASGSKTGVSTAVPVASPSWSTGGTGPTIPKGLASLGPCALVTQPAKLPSLTEWTIETRRPRGHLMAIAFTSDSRQVAVAGECGAIRFLDAENGQLVRILVGQEAEVVELALSPDGVTLASLGMDGTVRLWDTRASRLVGAITGQGRVLCIGWSPDGKQLALGKEDKTITLWDVRPGRAIGSLTGHSTRVDCVSWSPDGKWIASGEGWEGGSVRIWSPKLRRQQFSKCYDKVIGAIAWSPDSKFLAIGQGDRGKKVYVLNIESFTETAVVEADEEKIRSLAWSPDGRRLAAKTRSGGKLTVWQAGSWSTLLSIEIDMDRGNRDLGDMAWSPDGKLLAICDNCRRGRNGAVGVRLWDAATGQLRWAADASLPGLNVADVSKDGRLVACGGSDNKEAACVWIWDLAPDKPLTVLHPFERPATALAFSPNDKTLAIGYARCRRDSFTVNLWQVEEGRFGKDWIGKGDGDHASLAWSPDSTKLALSSRAGPVCVIAPGGDGAKEWLLPGGEARALAWSPDGKTIALGTSGRDKHVYFLDAASGKVLGQTTQEGDGGNAIAWAPDSKRLAFQDGKGKVWMWSLASNHMLGPLPGNDHTLRAVAWSPDGKKIATGQDSAGLIHLWDSRTARLLDTLSGLGRNGLNLAWSRDGRTIVAACGTMVRLWQGGGGRPGLTFLPLGTADGLVISAEGHVLPSPGVDPDKEIVHVALANGCQATLSAAEFAAKCGWKNDSNKVRR